jgi:hypothetical protein
MLKQVTRIRVTRKEIERFLHKIDLVFPVLKYIYDARRYYVNQPAAAKFFLKFMQKKEAFRLRGAVYLISIISILSATFLFTNILVK